MTNNNNKRRFDFTTYTADELKYTQKTLLKALDAWADAEIALCDAHIRHDEEPTLTDWQELFHALKEIEQAVSNY